MLERLGHDALVCRDDEQSKVHTGGACQHLPDEALVAGHVHKPQYFAGRKLQRSKPKLDRDAPFLFFL